MCLFGALDDIGGVDHSDIAGLFSHILVLPREDALPPSSIAFLDAYPEKLQRAVRILAMPQRSLIDIDYLIGPTYQRCLGWAFPAWSALVICTREIPGHRPPP